MASFAGERCNRVKTAGTICCTKNASRITPIAPPNWLVAVIPSAAGTWTTAVAVTVGRRSNT